MRPLNIAALDERARARRAREHAEWVRGNEKYQRWLIKARSRAHMALPRHLPSFNEACESPGTPIAGFQFLQDLGVHTTVAQTITKFEAEVPDTGNWWVKPVVLTGALYETLADQLDTHPRNICLIQGNLVRFSFDFSKRRACHRTGGRWIDEAAGWEFYPDKRDPRIFEIEQRCFYENFDVLIDLKTMAIQRRPETSYWQRPPCLSLLSAFSRLGKRVPPPRPSDEEIEERMREFFGSDWRNPRPRPEPAPEEPWRPPPLTIQASEESPQPVQISASVEATVLIERLLIHLDGGATEL